MKYLLILLMVFSAAVKAAAAQANVCAEPGITGLYLRAVNTGSEVQRKALSAAMFTAVRCLASNNMALPKSELRGPYAVVIEYLSLTRQVSIAIATDEEIDAMARRFKKGKRESKRNTCNGEGL